MTKIDYLIDELCPNGVKFEELRNKNLFKFYYGKGNKIPEDIGGIYDVYGANGVVSHIDEYNCEDVSIIGHIGAVGMVNRCKEKCFVTYNGTIAEVVDKSKVNSQYLYYVLTTLDLPSYKKGSQPFLSVSDFDKIRIPVPPLEVQCEIVHVLDDFTLLSAELSAELKARQQQLDYYLNKLFKTNNYELKNLEDICEIKGRIGFRGYTKEDMVSKGEGAISLTASNITKGFHVSYDNNTYLSWEKYEESPEIMVKEGDIIICQRGSIGKSAIIEYLPEKATINPQLLLLKNIKCNNYYLALYLRTSMFLRDLEKITGHGTVQMIAQKDVKKISIPIPTLDVQEKIVKILKKFDKLCNDILEGLPAEIEARQKQYEYYRDKLLTFKELKVNE